DVAARRDLKRVELRREEDVVDDPESLQCFSDRRFRAAVAWRRVDDPAAESVEDANRFDRLLVLRMIGRKREGEAAEPDDRQQFTGAWDRSADERLLQQRGQRRDAAEEKAGARGGTDL